MRYRLRRATGLLRAGVLMFSSWLSPARAAMGWLFRRELQGLNDALAATPLAGSYWVWGGALLGWAREGQVLDHDTADADFAVLSEDAHLIEQAVPALERAGYGRLWRFRNSSGQVTEYTFVRHGAKFEFFVLFPAGRPGLRTYFVYDGGVELESEISDQPLEPFEFVDRRWLKPRFHEQELREVYGDWQTPDPGWHNSQSPCIVARRPWTERDKIWA